MFSDTLKILFPLSAISLSYTFIIRYPDDVKKIFLMKAILILLSAAMLTQASAQTCYSISNRTNGNGNPGTCGGPNCSGNAKTGHIDLSFGASCPGTIPSLQLISVTSGAMPSPFCFDPGNCISPGSVRYCFRGSNLPSSGFMTLTLTQGALLWSCTYDVAGGAGILLPVKLSFFTVKLSKGKVETQWRTEQEIDNKQFEIERSVNGVSFSPITVIAGKGTISTSSDYTFTDEAPLKGISFYRLKQEDIDGKATYSAIKRIDNRLPGIEINSIFPNPVHDLVNLSINVDHSMLLTAKIYDAAGQQVAAANRIMQAGLQSWRVNLPLLKAGLYKLVITGEEGSMLSEKLVII